METRDRLAAYLELLREWGSRTNLVGSTEPSALARHVADSMAAAGVLPSGAAVVDLGSGAGFPGVPLAIARPDLALTLVEIRERRVHFLRHVVRSLGLGNARVERVRIEDAPGEPYNVALLRAVAPLERSLALALPWVAPGGEIQIWSREDGGGLAAPPFARIPLVRGFILRFHAAEVSCGTPSRRA